MKQTILRIQGMSCGNCVRHVTGALEKLEGVRSVDVSLAEKRARVEHDPSRPTVEQMIAAVDDAGYESELAG